MNTQRLLISVLVHPASRIPRRLVSTARFIDICACALVAGLLTWKLGQVLESTLPPPLHGEWWGVHSFSDFLTLMGAKHFVDDGFLANYFTANITVGFPEFARGWQYYQVPLLTQNSGIFYTHYGSLDTIVSGILMNLGVQGLTQFYLIFTIASFGALFLWYTTSSMIFGRIIGIISTAVIGTNITFLSVSETISAESIAIHLTMVAIFFFIIAQRIIRHPAARIAAYVVVWTTCFLQANNNPQFLLFIPVFIGGYLWIYAPRTRNSVSLFFVLCSSIVIGVTVHLALNAWVLGGTDNMMIDLVSAVTRRTSGFSIAVEAGYRDFQISQFPVYIENMMWNFWHLEFFGITTLVIITRWMASRFDDNEEKHVLLRQWKMMLIMLSGGLGFILIFIQATVTQPMDILKVMLPGIGTLLGMTVVIGAKYLFQMVDQLPIKGAFTIFIGLILLPYSQHVATGVPFSDIFSQRDSYQGGSQEQVRAVATFLKENTKHGDIILTNIHTGETGHNLYPHPSWEYLSVRRIEVFNTVDQANESLNQLLNKQKSLLTENPAKQIGFHVLISRWQSDTILGDLCRKAGIKIAAYDSPAWWLSYTGVDPYPYDVRSYDLYRIDPARWLTNSIIGWDNRRLMPDGSTPWTSIKSGAEIAQEATTKHLLPRFSFISNGTLTFSSSTLQNFNFEIPDNLFNNQTGSSAEIRIRIINAPNQIRDSAMFSLQDGVRELKLSFTGNLITIYDRNRIIAAYQSPNDKASHTYRLTITGEIGRAYLDGTIIASSHLTQMVTGKVVLFGDIASVQGEYFTGEIDYVAYSAKGAYTPSGRRTGPGLENEDLRAWGIDPSGIRLSTGSSQESTVPWTRIFKVGTTTASQSLPEWDVSYPSHAFIVSGTLAMASFGIGGSNLILKDSELNNLTGTTLEVGMWLPRTALEDPDSAILSVQDGRREVKLGFFSRHISVFDQNQQRTTMPISASNAYHVYRITLIGDTAKVYVDGIMMATVTVRNEVTSKAFLLGNFSTSEGHSAAVIDYIAYSNLGDYAPRKN